MLYCNDGFKIVEKQLNFGTLKCVELGEEGRGRKQILLPVPNSFITGNYVTKGFHKNYSIGLTKSGKPRVNKLYDDDYIYLLLTSKGGYTRRGNGGISTMMYDGTEEIITAWGADGLAGGIGDYPVSLIKVPNDGKTRIVRCKPSGGGYRDNEHQEKYYICKKNTVDEVWNGELQDYIDMKNAENLLDLIRKDMPQNYLYTWGIRISDKNKVSELYDILANIKILSLEEIKILFPNNIKETLKGKTLFSSDPEFSYGTYIDEKTRLAVVEKNKLDFIKSIINTGINFSNFSPENSLYEISELESVLVYLKWNLDNGFLK